MRNNTVLPGEIQNVACMQKAADFFNEQDVQKHICSSGYVYFYLKRKERNTVLHALSEEAFPLWQTQVVLPAPAL